MWKNPVRYGANPFERIFMRSIALATATAALLLVSAPASALSTDFGVDIYMSSPKVQGTAVSTGLTTEDFNAISIGACPATIAIGAITGNCNVETAKDYGGASTNANDATPTTTGPGSNYASTATDGGTPAAFEFSVDLAEPAKYLGLWWSAGSPGNTIELFSEGELVASITVDGILELLSGTTVTTVGGGSVDTEDYDGNPRDTSLSPGEPFLYLNLYATGGAAFDSISLIGGGFELDNIAISDLPQVPGSTEVSVEFFAGENEPPAAPLADTGFDVQALVGVGLIAIAVGAVALRRRATIQ
jgi:hypothetical protein